MSEADETPAPRPDGPVRVRIDRRTIATCKDHRAVELLRRAYPDAVVMGKEPLPGSERKRFEDMTTEEVQARMKYLVQQLAARGVFQPGTGDNW